jgi:anti-anti-sigma factor
MSGREDSIRARVGPAVVALPAEFNVASAWRAGEELDSVFAPGITTVIADLTATTSCDSSGAAVLALAHDKAVAHNAELRLAVPSAAVRHVLALAGLSRVLRTYPSLAEALAAAPVPGQVSDERPAEMEQIYERWVTAFSESSGFSPGLLVTDPARAVPGVFRLFATGSALLRFAGGLNGFSSGWPDGLGPGGPDRERADLISAFFGILRDWIAASGNQGSIQAEPDVSRALDERITELAKAGFIVAARERFLLLTGGVDAKTLSWRIVDIRVQRSDRGWTAQQLPGPAPSPRFPSRSAGSLPSAGMPSGRER